MSYKFANNDYVYSIYENKIMNILQTDNLDFLSKEKHMGIFDVSIEFGQKYCKQILIEFPEINYFLHSDKFKFDLENFMIVGNEEKFINTDLNITITASAARYIYHAFLINNYLKEKFGSTKIDILEIGGGYGGLSYWLRKINSYISTYTIIDLPAASKLQEKCASEWNHNIKTINDPTTFNKSTKPLFIISNYGYSEFNQHYQDLYKNTVLKLADAGFMIWNNWSGVYKFTDLPMKQESERPSFEGIYNLFIYF